MPPSASSQIRSMHDICYRDARQDHLRVASALYLNGHSAFVAAEI
jgi:hypothetical protein